MANGLELLPQGTLAFGVALGAGLLIGIERERRKGTGPTRGVLPARSRGRHDRLEPELQRPELYGMPKERGMNFRAAPTQRQPKP